MTTEAPAEGPDGPAAPAETPDVDAPPDAPDETTPEVPDAPEVTEDAPDVGKAPVEVEAPVKPPPITGLVHYPPASAKLGSTLNLKVKLPSPDYQVTVFYRPAGGTYSQKNLFGQAGTFTGPIPIDERFAEGLEYWIKATPREGGAPKNFKSGFQPHKIPVK